MLTVGAAINLSNYLSDLQTAFNQSLKLCCCWPRLVCLSLDDGFGSNVVQSMYCKLAIGAYELKTYSLKFVRVHM